jgi:nucleoside-diphosphate-sugar epimerase
MRVLLTGATGFIGSYVLRELIDRGHDARCLLRDPSAPLDVQSDRIERMEGDVTDPESLKRKAHACDAVIHLVGIIEEHASKGITFERVHDQGTLNVVTEATRAGVETFIHMSANGASDAGKTAYQRTKWAGEQHVQNAGFRHWTIFRPTVVFGDPGPGRPEFASTLLRKLIRPFPVTPIFGDGRYKLQFVSVEDVAAAIVQALDRPVASDRIYCAAGPTTLDYIDAINVITEAAGLSRRPKVKQPIWLTRPVVQTAGKAGILPITPDQFEMLIEGNTCIDESFARDFDLRNLPFDTSTLTYLNRT